MDLTTQKRIQQASSFLHNAERAASVRRIRANFSRIDDEQLCDGRRGKVLGRSGRKGRKKPRDYGSARLS